MRMLHHPVPFMSIPGLKVPTDASKCCLWHVDAGVSVAGVPQECQNEPICTPMGRPVGLSWLFLGPLSPAA